jgi:hypothetical protein
MAIWLLPATVVQFVAGVTVTVALAVAGALVVTVTVALAVAGALVETVTVALAMAGAACAELGEAPNANRIGEINAIFFNISSSPYSAWVGMAKLALCGVTPFLDKASPYGY